MLQITINDRKFDVEKNNSVLKINDEVVLTDIAQTGNNSFHVISHNKSYNAEVVSFDTTQKTAVIKVNGNTYPVTAKDQFDLLLEQMGMSNLNSAKVDDLKAPMPGLVLKVLVAEGDTVQKGDNLFVLEAMKMENIIKSPGEAVVRSVKIKPGDKVEKGQVLIAFNQ
ncbi:acetyl-CoA carboxylase biotin carboxyl carrier protein subunit [Mucilaginibacter ginkgonis]|uniref:Biotin/lipoyl-binding protein n=1 Tax=Mucilaginibacter ginkgonis TaxID=2682091 RepID=A0A6I4HZ06_9SPHI|nr:acetyl-CoA carboxylase biotin carboxyl carrier protein subunit [Mucilaginibacter ginkgonis]QQL49697.1 biotin/lipoyl-binding protein [Mucilaginibacter ginkgonis]